MARRLSNNVQELVDDINNRSASSNASTNLPVSNVSIENYLFAPFQNSFINFNQTYNNFKQGFGNDQPTLIVGLNEDHTVTDCISSFNQMSIVQKRRLHIRLSEILEEIDEAESDARIQLHNAEVAALLAAATATIAATAAYEEAYYVTYGLTKKSGYTDECVNCKRRRICCAIHRTAEHRAELHSKLNTVATLPINH
jgi:hypothetical protein